MSQGYSPSISIDFEQTNKVLWYMISERNSILICNGQVSFLSGYPISKLPSHSWGMLDQACSWWEAGFPSHHFSAARTWAQIWPEQDLGSQVGDSKVKASCHLPLAAGGGAWWRRQSSAGGLAAVWVAALVWRCCLSCLLILQSFLGSYSVQATITKYHRLGGL